LQALHSIEGCGEYIRKSTRFGTAKILQRWVAPRLTVGITCPEVGNDWLIV